MHRTHVRSVIVSLIGLAVLPVPDALKAHTIAHAEIMGHYGC